MRNFFLLFILSTGILHAQNPEPSPIFMQLNEVEQTPAYPGCVAEDFACSIDKITSYFIENIDNEIFKSLAPEEAVVILKFIIDSEGKVRSPKAQSKSEELKAAGLKILQELPYFSPAVHNGQRVNVPINIPLKLESKDPVQPLESKTFDTRAVFVGCENSPDPADCSQKMLLNDFINSFFDLGIRTKGDIIKSQVILEINEKGKVTEVNAEGTNKKLNNAILRWGKKLDNFIPAIIDGRNVPMTYQFPITFSSTN